VEPPSAARACLLARAAKTSLAVLISRMLTRPQLLSPPRVQSLVHQRVLGYNMRPPIASFVLQFVECLPRNAFNFCVLSGRVGRR